MHSPIIKYTDVKITKAGIPDYVGYVLFKQKGMMKSSISWKISQ
jgi:hypothetical protein